MVRSPRGPFSPRVKVSPVQLLTLPKHHRQCTSSRTLSGEFVLSQLVCGAVGAFAYPGFVFFFGWPDLVESIALLWLALPLIAAIAFRLHQEFAQAFSILSLCGFLTFIAIETGGLASMFVPVFLIVPIEASLSGRRRLVAVAGGASITGIIAIISIQSLGLVPEPRVPAELRTILATAVLIGAVIYCVGVALAVERANAKARRIAAEGEWKYRMLAENAVDLITRHGPDGRMKFVSPSSRSLLGFDPAELLEHAPAELVHGDDRQRLQNALIRASYHGECSAAEVRMRRKEGGYVWVELRCRPANDGPVPRDIVTVTRDVSGHKRQELEITAARDQAETANRAKSRFLANMSHELRTPLNAIIGFSDMMRQEMFGALGHAKYREYSGLINDSGQHLLELISDILDMSKIEAGKYEISLEPVNLRDAIAKCLSTVKLSAEKAGVVLREDIEPSVHLLVADNRAVKQILLNLLSNAIKFTPTGGIVTVQVRRDEESIRLSVCDTGVGIPDEALDRVGQPFEQVAGEYVRTQGGTGLGLAVVRALAELHGGRVTVDSALGDGTTVSVTFPSLAAADVPVEKSEANVIFPERFRSRA
jgi:two-component system, cell cycle sensor histidine kinase DivJ